jgi:hypothetical protein
MFPKRGSLHLTGCIVDVEEEKKAQEYKSWDEGGEGELHDIPKRVARM